MTTSRQADDASSPPEPAVVGLRTRPGRVVFTEEGNCDGWIATDFVVEPEQ